MGHYDSLFEEVTLKEAQEELDSLVAYHSKITRKIGIIKYDLRKHKTLTDFTVEVLKDKVRELKVTRDSLVRSVEKVEKLIKKIEKGDAVLKTQLITAGRYGGYY
jgi:hypothetical protein